MKSQRFGLEGSKLLQACIDHHRSQVARHLDLRRSCHTKIEVGSILMTIKHTPENIVYIGLSHRRLLYSHASAGLCVKYWTNLDLSRHLLWASSAPIQPFFNRSS